MIISVINQKGGVGKTTTAVNLAVGLAGRNSRTLLVDLDPQGNATSGVNCSGQISPTLYEALVAQTESNWTTSSDKGSGDAPDPADSSLRPAIQPGPVSYLDVIGASPELAGAEIDLSSNERRDTLYRTLRPLDKEYSFIIIDTPPSLSLLTVNALVVAQQLIIPVQCEYYALEGLGQLLRTLERIRRNLNPDLNVLGLLRTMYDGRLGLSKQVSMELENHFPHLVFKTSIPRNVRLAEAPSHGKPVSLYDSRSPGAQAYAKLAQEVKQRAKVVTDKTVTDKTVTDKTVTDKTVTNKSVTNKTNAA